MNDKELTKKSKFLSLVLRHKPEEIGITLDENGWTNVSELLKKIDISRESLDEIVATNSKKRFEFNDNGTKIRACQGHSVEVDLKLEPKSPPAILYHGTSNAFIDSIKKEGLKPKSRNHVHLSIDKETALKVGQRHGGKTVILVIKAEEYHKDGAEFYLSNNGVWLAKEVPYKYIEFGY
jgi:putative RNA 2'-phosphotransferase